MSRPLLFALVSLLALVATHAMATPASADNPWDAEQRALANEARRLGRSPRAIVPILELWRQYDEASPDATIAALDAVSSDRRVAAPTRSYVEALRARAALRQGDRAAAEATTEALGYVTAWQVVGPFDNEGKAGFDQSYPPEDARSAPFSPDASFSGKGRSVRWRAYPDVAPYGYVSLDAVQRPREHVCAYAQTTVHSERAQPLSLWAGAGGAIKVWWNGAEVLADATYRQPDPDRHVAMVAAQRGPNRLLVKSCVAESTWGFFVRLGDPRGGHPADLEIDATEMPVPPDTARSRLPRAPTPFLAALETAADGGSPQALEDLARVLAFTGADDAAELRARQLAARAATDAPTVERLKLAASLAGHRGEMMRFVQMAEAEFPRNPEVRLLRAVVERTSLVPESALRALEGLVGRTPVDTLALRAARLRAEVLESLELPAAALAQLDALAGHAEKSTAHAKATMEAALLSRQADRAVATTEQLLTLRHDDLAMRRFLVADAIRRGEEQRAEEHLAVVHALGRDDTTQLEYVAGVREAMGDTEGAEETLQEAARLAPEDAATKIAHGRLLLRLDRSDAARTLLEEALALRPQDATTRELLEQIAPRERPDERYAIDRDALLGRRGEAAGFPATVLQDLTVNTVYGNGLGASFRQLAVEIHDDEGARQWRTYSIVYDPGAQRVDLRLAAVVRRDGRVLEGLQTFERQLGEPWYNIYYDTRALVVVFPTLEPGDTVELRWRIDDVAHRNLFADYYGDLVYLQGFEPVRHTEYILRTPKDRTFYFNEPGLEGLAHTQREEGGVRVDRFVANDVPALRSEQDMPGMTEVAPYLHVSTYRTWEDVGRWWWGLVQDQLYADARLKRTVAELVAGAPDLKTKVRRIHDWVVLNTRYVALEFGIHGYKPYRVPQVIERGFGDCKDKASLLFTMFREAGIDAHMVLLRTRRNGRIRDLPASLAVFDHAIAYVPALDLYIDGTAEHAGLEELPQMDQGVTVLHVWPEGSELRRTPVLPPTKNLRDRHLNLRLAPDGSATVETRERIVGTHASSYRSTFQAEGTRQERLERNLRESFPGLQLSSHRFTSDLDDLEAPVTYQWVGRVPQAAQPDGEALRIAPSATDALVPALARTPSRQHTLDLGGTSVYQEERVIRYPAGWQASVVPESGVADSPFGRLELELDGNSDQVTSRMRLEIRKDRITPEEYPAFRRWVEAADRLLRQRIRIEREGTR